MNTLPSTIFVVTIVTAGLWLAPEAYAQTLQMERTPSGHYTLEARVEGSEPYTFIFDTGASHTALSQVVAEEVGFVSLWTDYDDVQALTERFEAERFSISNLQISGLGAVSLNSVVIPATPEEPGQVAGLLGSDALPSSRYRIDFSTSEMTVGDVSPAHHDGIYDSDRHLLFASARLGRGARPINVLIDSGSARTLVNPVLERYVQRYWSGISINVSGVSGRIIETTDSVALRGMQIGGVCFSRVSALIADLDAFNGMGWSQEPSIILGLDVLENVELTVDTETGYFEFSPGGDNPECDNDRVQRSPGTSDSM